MPRPVQPVIHTAPTLARGEEEQFSSDADRLFTSFPELIEYADAIADYIEQQSAAALAEVTLGTLSLASNGGKFLAVNSGGTAFEAKALSTNAFATKAQALAGTSTTTLLSPLTVRQFVDSVAGVPAWVQIRKISISSDLAIVEFSNTDSQTDFDKTKYDEYRITFRNCVINNTGKKNILVELARGGAAFLTGYIRDRTTTDLAMRNGAPRLSGNYDTFGFYGTGTSLIIIGGAANDKSSDNSQLGSMNHMEIVSGDSDDGDITGIRIYGWRDGTIPRNKTLANMVKWTSGEIILYGRLRPSE